MDTTCTVRCLDEHGLQQNSTLQGPGFLPSGRLSPCTSSRPCSSRYHAPGVGRNNRIFGTATTKSPNTCTSLSMRVKIKHDGSENFGQDKEIDILNMDRHSQRYKRLSEQQPRRVRTRVRAYRCELKSNTMDQKTLDRTRK